MPEFRPLSPVPANPDARGIRHFVRRYPVLVVLLVCIFVSVIVTGWFFSTKIFPTKTHITVLLYRLDESASGDRLTVSLKRITYWYRSRIAMRRGGDPVPAKREKWEMWVFEPPELKSFAR